MRKLFINMGLGLFFAIGFYFADIHDNSKSHQFYGIEIGFNTADAKRGFSSGRSSFSFSRSSSSSTKSSGSLWNRSSSKPAVSKPSSGGYVKKDTKPAAKVTNTTVKSANGYTKGGTAATNSGSRKLNSGKSGAAIQRNTASKGLTEHRAATSKFSKPTPNSNMANASTYKNTPLYTANKPVPMKTYYSRRDTYYDTHRWSAPTYAYHSQPSFGMYDGLFMWAMLDGIHDRNMYYHHRNDAGMREWRQEADRMAADNAELRAKLAKLDANVNQLQASGVPANDKYVPNGVDPGVILAAEVATGAGDLTVNFGSGGKSGNYFAFCNEIKAAATGSVPVICHNTNGSVANMDGLVSGEFDAIMVQANVYTKWVRDNPDVKIDGLQASIYPEVVFMLANKDSGIDEISDVDPRKHRIYAAGSGAVTTLADFAVRDSDYDALAKGAVQVEPNAKSLELVANNPNGVMFYVCGMKCGLIDQANASFGGKLQMAAVNDWDLNNTADDGDESYRFVKVPETYKNLQPSGWLSSGDVETIAVDAVLIVSKEWVESKGVSGLSKLEAAIWPAMGKIQAQVGIPD